MIRSSVISVAFSLVTLFSIHLLSASSVNAQAWTHSMDTGVVFLSPGQTLRVSANGVGLEPVTVQFKKLEYFEAGMTEGVVRYQVGSQSTTGSIVVSGDQAFVFNAVASGAGIRVQFYSSSQNLKAKAFVISPAPSGGSAPAVEEITLTHHGFLVRES